MLSALIFCERLFITGRAGVACEVIFPVPSLVLRVFLHSPKDPVIVDDQSPTRVEHPTGLGKEARALEPVESQGDRDQPEGTFSAEASTYCTPASRGAGSSISREVSVPTTWETTSFRATVDLPVPQATSRAQGTGSWSFRKSLIFFITNGWKQGRLLAYRSAEFRDSK